MFDVLKYICILIKYLKNEYSMIATVPNKLVMMAGETMIVMRLGCEEMTMLVIMVASS